MSIAIIGAGITGLTLALELKKRGFEVRVYESSSQAGGVIKTYRKDGWLAECGPNSILESSSRITGLVNDLDLNDERIYANRSAEKRYVARYGKPVKVPGSAMEFLKSSLLSNKSKFKILKEPFVKPLPADEESLADFVRRRLGEEVLDYFVYPFVGGIYSGDPEKLAVKHAFKRFYILEKKYGSIMLGQFKAAEIREDHEIPKNKAQSFSFKRGLQTLPETISKKLGGDVKLNTKVTSVTRNAGSFEIETRENGEISSQSHEAVIYCGAAHNLDKMTFKLQGSADISGLSDIHYPSVSSVAIGLPRRQIEHPADGFGVLIPQKEDFKILGTQFNSSVFANRTPDMDHVLLTTFIGGTRFPEAIKMPDEALLEIILKDLSALLGVKGDPVFVKLTRWPKAIPQYEIGYGKFMDLMDAVERENPGFYLAGNYRTGIAVGDCISRSVDLANSIAKDFSRLTKAKKNN